jgi:hypothetical protein
MRSRSALAARTRDEMSRSIPCSGVSSSGTLLRNGLREEWTVQSGPPITIELTIRRGSVARVTGDRFQSAIPCD